MLGALTRAGVVSVYVSVATVVVAQPADPVVGNWRGTLTSADGTASPVIITIGKAGDAYGGSTSGVGEGSEVSLRRVTVDSTKLSIEGVSESKLGTVRIGAELTVEGPRMRGAGTVGVGNLVLPVTFDLARRQRQDVAQRQVAQRAEYFSGRWTFEYLGGEFPPLSAGERSGTVTFSAPSSSQFVTGVVEGETLGKPFKESIAIGVNADIKSVVYHERRADGVELISNGNWTSPLAIVFQTAPLTSGGRTFQLRRVISILSETAFDVSEEFSVDGGTFKKLGTAHYTKN